MTFSTFDLSIETGADIPIESRDPEEVLSILGNNLPDYKIKLFKKTTKREIDRLQSGGFYLINEAELQEALRIKGDITKLLTGIKRKKP